MAAEFLTTTKDISHVSLGSTPPVFPDSRLARNFAKRLHLLTTLEQNRESSVGDMMFVFLEAVGFSEGNWIVRYV